MALDKHVVVRLEALRFARAGGIVLFFVGDLHSLEKLDEEARARLAVASDIRGARHQCVGGDRGGFRESLWWSSARFCKVDGSIRGRARILW